MSDSDDTDILLLIPPDFFVAETNANESFNYDRIDANNILQPIITTPKRGASQNILMNGKSTEMDRKVHRISPSSSGSLKKQSASGELNNCQTRDRSVCASQRLSEATATRTPMKSNDDNYLKEIDSYLAGYTSSGTKIRDVNAILASNGITPLSFSDGKRRYGQSTVTNGIPSTPSNTNARCGQISAGARHINTNDDVTRTLDGGRMSDWSFALQHQNGNHNHEPLLSLNEVWDADPSTARLDIEEEQLRRRQCERQLESMQHQVREYQEKISAAIKMDQAKNEALAKLHDTNSNLVSNISKLEQTVADMELRLHREKDLHGENNELKIKVQLLDRELLDAVRISKFLQEKNQMLEGKVNHMLQSNTDVREMHNRQMDEIQARLSSAMHTEDLLNNDILKLSNENLSLKNQCDSLKLSNENYLAEKRRADELDKDNTEMKIQLDTFIGKEKDVIKELEMQRLSLKAYYQAQLEQVVGEKLNEYQKQLDAVEETLKTEARKNERLIAERAIKQIDLINQKNNQEFSLMEEKHKQELELYRIRLDNAAKTIRMMDEKLKGQRSDIAKRLHNVIESQWQQTLEIISNPRTDGAAGSSKPKKTNPAINNHSSEMELDHIRSLAALDLK